MPADSPHNGTPMLYSRMASEGAFEPQRNLMTRTFALDGGGSIAADSNGRVYVSWHGKAPDSDEGEGGRRVWLTTSSDHGESFSEERAISDDSTGACACCGMRLFVDSDDHLLALYRSARDVVHRDVYVLRSEDQGKTFDDKLLHPWEIGACPMSSMSFLEAGHSLLAAWETAQQVYWAPIASDSPQTFAPISPPGDGDHRKHPVLARNGDGSTLLVWVSVAGWGKPGELSWHVFSSEGKPVPSATNDLPKQAPPWSMAAVFSKPDGSFTIVY